MAGRVYIYYYPGEGAGQDDENLQITTDPLEAVGAGKVMIATAAPSDTQATFFIFNQNSDQKISRIHIEPKTISAAEIANATLTATQLASKTITANVIADNTITSSQIAANTITAGQILAHTITAAEIAANTITASQIAANTITASQIAANTITASQIAANTITSSQIAANTITAGQIAAGTITGNEIAASTVTAGKISVTSLAAISTNVGTVTVDSSGYIRGGATGYMTGTGFFMGYHSDVESTVDSYTAPFDDETYSGDVYYDDSIWLSYTGAAQSFSCEENIYLTKAKFALAKIGSPTGTLTVKVYAGAGTYGTSSVP